MEPNDRTITDRDFALNLLREQKLIAERESLTGAQRAELLKLLNHSAVILQIVDERIWQAGTWRRMGKFGGFVKAGMATFIAAGGVLAATTIFGKYFGN